MGNGSKKKSKKNDDRKNGGSRADATTEADAPEGHQAPGFNLDDPVFPPRLLDRVFGSGDFPYPESLDEKSYEKSLLALQCELVKLQKWTIDAGERLVIVFEGRDAAGKGGAIGAFREYMSPRQTRIVALPKPTEIERGQWYFQRYATELPTRGEIVMFDRSWYNRAGVEKVMGFCKPEETEQFLKEAPRFEEMLTTEGIHLVKFYIDVGFEMQLKRFHDRRHNPLKVWKVSPIDYAAITKYDEYGAARDRMLEMTHTDWAPWTLLLGNDKKRLRLNAIRFVLSRFDYPEKDRKVIGEIDPNILGTGPGFLLRSRSAG
jgi:polyphosphate kinase 2